MSEHLLTNLARPPRICCSLAHAATPQTSHTTRPPHTHNTHHTRTHETSRGNPTRCPTTRATSSSSSSFSRSLPFFARSRSVPQSAPTLIPNAHPRGAFRQSSPASTLTHTARPSHSTHIQTFVSHSTHIQTFISHSTHIQTFISHCAPNTPPARWRSPICGRAASIAAACSVITTFLTRFLTVH